MSSSSSNDSFTEIATLSPQELSRLVTDQNMNRPILDAFPSYSPSTMNLRNYAFLSDSIDVLERELERHQLEREQIYDDLLHDRRFRRRIGPILKDYRNRRRRTRAHPYDRSPTPPRTPSDQNSINPPSSIQILPEEALARIPTPSDRGSTTSFHTAIDEATGTTRLNPIIIVDDDERLAGPSKIDKGKGVPCPRCKQIGHRYYDCETPMRTFKKCRTCAWTGQETCNHYDASPVWIKKTRVKLGLGLQTS